MDNKQIQITDCWNKIGVWRNHAAETCPKLVEVRHCRHCDVFINAGLDLLDRNLPEGYIHENTEVYRLEKQLSDDSFVSCLFFRLGREWYAIKTILLKEIVEISNVHSLPHNRHKVISGVINVRGEIEICISLKEMVSAESLSANNSDAKTRMVVINLQSGKFVFSVDEVMGVFKIKEQDIQQAPTSIASKAKQITNGVFDYEGKHIGFVDEELLNNQLLEMIA